MCIRTCSKWKARAWITHVSISLPYSLRITLLRISLHKSCTMYMHYTYVQGHSMAPAFLYISVSFADIYLYNATAKHAHKLRKYHGVHRVKTS